MAEDRELVLHAVLGGPHGVLWLVPHGCLADVGPAARTNKLPSSSCKNTHVQSRELRIVDSIPYYTV